MKIKKIIIGIAFATVVALGGTVAITKTVTTQANEKSYTELISQAKEDLQSELDEKYTKESEEKDKQIEDLQNQLNSANEQINTLQQNQVSEQTETPATSNETEVATKSYVDNAKEEVKQEAEKGDKEVEEKITYDTINKAREEELKKNPPAPVEKEKDNKKNKKENTNY